MLEIIKKRPKYEQSKQAIIRASEDLEHAKAGMESWLHSTLSDCGIHPGAYVRYTRKGGAAVAFMKIDAVSLYPDDQDDGGYRVGFRGKRCFGRTERNGVPMVSMGPTAHLNEDDEWKVVEAKDIPRLREGGER